jgi:hypothetical protein
VTQDRRKLVLATGGSAHVIFSASALGDIEQRSVDTLRNAVYEDAATVSFDPALGTVRAPDTILERAPPTPRGSTAWEMPEKTAGTSSG